MCDATCYNEEDIHEHLKEDHNAIVLVETEGNGEHQTRGLWFCCGGGGGRVD